jgi:hypothetical protein
MKPVAWMSPDGKVSTTEGKLFYIPLYTAPRELSDEEIRQIYIEAMESPYTHQQSYFGFARAILKKASEK